MILKDKYFNRYLKLDSELKVRVTNNIISIMKIPEAKYSKELLIKELNISEMNCNTVYKIMEGAGNIIGWYIIKYNNVVII